MVKLMPSSLLLKIVNVVTFTRGYLHAVNAHAMLTFANVACKKVVASHIQNNVLVVDDGTISCSRRTFFSNEVFGFVALIQDDQTIPLSVSSSQPLHDMEQTGPWHDALIPGIRQFGASPIACVSILIIHSLKRRLLQ